MKKLVITLMAIFVIGWQGPSFASSSVDALIQKLEDKGILTNQDANELKGEISQNEQASQQSTVKSMMPDWVSGLKISGDFRLRDQLNVRKVFLGGSSQGGNNFEQNRSRIRARLNFEDQINDKVKLIVGIATDGGTPRSNNYTLGGSSAFKSGVLNEDSFGKPQVVLNKAYAVYTPNDMVTLMGGKLDNPVWEPAGASFFWDPDITPEGGSIQISKKINDYVTPWVQEDIFVVHDLAPTTTVKTDPYFMITQGGFKGNLTDKVYYKTGLTWYDYNNPSHQLSSLSLGTNTETARGAINVLRYNFNKVIVEGVDIGMNDPLGELLDNIPLPNFIPHPYVAQAGIFGDYAQNEDTGNRYNKAWEIGGYMGNSAINGWGTWKLQSYYKVLERDSWLDVLPDDDFYSGDTNTKGWRTQLDVGLAKNVWFTMSYFHTNLFKLYNSLDPEVILSNPAGQTTFSRSSPEDLFQWDLNFKF